MNRILVIRGGALGDFILTLPAIKLLRDRFPGGHLEILGARQIVVLAENRFYADAIRSLDSGQLAGFFAIDSVLPVDWINYFGSFDLILSFLSDRDGIFQGNLKRCGVRMFIYGPSKLSDREHAARQLARPLEQIGLRLQDPAARIYPNDTDRAFVRALLGDLPGPVIALHPGSGSEKKNWPIENWGMLGERFFSAGCTLLAIGGEADEERLRVLSVAWKDKPVRFIRNLGLPHIGALLEHSVFVGHDSGISHLAAAVGAQATLLFGPTDPEIWAPANENVTVLRAPGGDLSRLAIDRVLAAVEQGMPGTL